MEHTRKMKFSELPDWAIAGPVVYKDDKPLFVRHQIHKGICYEYRNLDDVIYIESIVRKYTDMHVEKPEYTLDVLKTLLAHHRYGKIVKS